MKTQKKNLKRILMIATAGTMVRMRRQFALSHCFKAQC